MNKINFQWEMDEVGFQALKEPLGAPDEVCGSVRFGDYLIEFRNTSDFYRESRGADIFVYGEEDWSGETLLANGVPYRELANIVVIPNRRTLVAFKKKFEQEMLREIDRLNLYKADRPTRTANDWSLQKKEKLPEKQEVRVRTKIGTIVVSEKNDQVYPGVWVGLERPNGRFDVAMIEVDQDADPDEQYLLKCHVYDTDIDHEDPVYDYCTDVVAIDNYIAEGK